MWKSWILLYKSILKNRAFLTQIFPGHNHLLATGTNDPANDPSPYSYHPRWRSDDNQNIKSSVLVVSRGL